MSRVTVCWRQIVSKALVAFFAYAFIPAAMAQTAVHGSAKSLFFVVGGLSSVPVHKPPGFEDWFAVAVVEINSPVETKNVAVTNLVLFDRRGRVANKLKRVVKVDVFDAEPFEAQPRSVGIFSYYLDIEGFGVIRPWDGTLPAGKIRLRVRVALDGKRIVPSRFRLTIGQHVIEGPVDGVWGN